MTPKKPINVILNPNQKSLLSHLVELSEGKKFIKTTYNEIARTFRVTKKAARVWIEALEREKLILKRVDYFGQSDKPTGIKIRVLNLADAFFYTDKKEKELNESLKNHILSDGNFSMQDWIEIRLRAIHGSSKIVRKKINAIPFREDSLTLRELNKIKNEIEILIIDQKTRKHFRKCFNFNSVLRELELRNLVPTGPFAIKLKRGETERGTNRKLSKKLINCLDLLMEEPLKKENWIGLAAFFEEMRMPDVIFQILDILDKLGNNYLRSVFHEKFEPIVGKMP
jgi:hypothetical protein